MRHLAVLAAYTVIAVIVTYPLIGNLSSHIVGFVHGDGYEMAHHMGWIKHALQTGGSLFNFSLLGYPDGVPAVTLWANPLQSFPGWLFAFVLPLPTAVNLHVLIALALNGWAMWRFARYLIHRETGNDLPIPAFIAGAAYMLFPTMQGHIGAAHTGLLMQFGVPLYAYALMRLSEGDLTPRQTRGRIATAALCFVLAAWGHTLQTITVLLPLTGVYALALIARKDYGSLRRITLAAGLGAVVLIVYLIPVIAPTLNTPAYADADGSVRYSADLLAAVTPSFRHPVFDRWEYTHRVLGVNIEEGSAFIGLFPVVLSVIAAVKFRRVRWWIILAGVAYTLSLGPLLKVFDQPIYFTTDGYPTYLTLPFGLVNRLPLIELARAPGRFNFATALAIGVLVAFGSAWVWMQINARWRTLVLLTMGAMIAFEYQTFFPVPLSPAAIPEAITALRDREDVRAVFNIPYDDPVVAKYGMYLQTAHGLPIIAGHDTRQTPVNPAKLNVLETTLSRTLLQEAGADVVIVHRDRDFDDTVDATARARLGAPVYEDAQIAMYETVNAPADEIGFETSQGSDNFITGDFDFFSRSMWLTMLVNADHDTPVALEVDGVIYQRWQLQNLLALPFREGYHRVRWLNDPPCPAVFDPSLRCPAVEPSLSTSVVWLPDDPHAYPYAFEGGITLEAALDCCMSGFPEGQRFLHLVWRFDQPITSDMVRYVHIVDQDTGELAYQTDAPLGMFDAGTGYAETITIHPPSFGLSAGTYAVYSGWYRLTPPDIIDNFSVLTGSEESTENAAYVTTLTVP